ncbi:hypothetical protein LZQ00_03660 [Sphingobacterium sp. SRCM116780]|uniref:hypothetical protein n=1 Tax=Sphingobacterium sp. SRCM116780 TaxID=2907623 RepID=UPI001F376880|nr:hypothetical protein [Sphingobacterium sp. SRCM116780]UIR56917.1 hypothetical protein LZQ00_03660 [Sphingobacterium sp. SRCM116780]
MIEHLHIIGFILIVLGFIHMIFPKYFNWKEELKSLSLINKEMMMIHTFFIAIAVILMGTLCLSSAQELVQTSLGKRICFGMGIFWILRLIIQFFGYSSKLWKGKHLETIVHIVFSCLWLYLSIIFIMTAFSQNTLL